MIVRTEIANIKTGKTEMHYTTEPIESLITAYLIHQGNTLKISDDAERNELVSKILIGDRTFVLGEYAYIVRGDNETVQSIWDSSERVKASLV